MPTVILFLLGSRLLANDADLSKQLRDRLEGATGLVTADLRRYLDDVIDGDRAALGDDALRVTLTADGIVVDRPY